jgi:hypothetical protein
MIARPAMRFCPFCAQDNPDDARECVHCGKRLPVLRNVPARPAASAPKPAAPRPVPPRPQPRAPSLAPPTTAAAAPHDAFAPTAAPGTLPPVRPPQPNAPRAPANGPGKATATPNDATLKPYSESDETHEVNAPTMPSAPTGTLLGIPAQEIPSSMHPASHGDSERRTTKPLSLTDVAKSGARAPVRDFDDDDDDAQTAVQAPATIVDDLPTSRNPRAEADAAEDAPTTARPAPRSRPIDRRTTPPAGVPTKPSLLPAMKQPHSPSLAPTKPTRLPSGQMPEPLPPPPSRVGNDAGAFPTMDAGPTPAIPTIALPPMPEHPKSGSIVDAVKYLLPLAKAIWARKQAQDAIRTLLHGDQRLLDSVLRDLGRTARAENVIAPAITEEIRLIAAEEDRRTAAEKAAADAETAMKKEDERWHFDEGERNSELVRREAELKVTDEDLRKDAELRRTHDAERNKIDAQIKAAEKRAAAADAKAAKAEVTPPEKGGGPNTAANARAEAAEARKQATALIPARDAARAEVEKLDGPINERTKKITDGRATVVQKKRELQEARALHDKTLAELQTAREQAGAERDAAERELTQRFVSAGTILNLNRVEHPKLQPLFARIDELKNGVNAREAAIVRLESERRLYDRGAVQKGLLTVGIAAGALILLLIILIVVIKR